MWLRLSRRHHFAYLPGIVGSYRVHAGSMSHGTESVARMRESHTRVLSKWIGAGLSPATERRVIDLLWGHTKGQLSMGAFASAREAFSRVAEVDPRPARKLVQLPGGSEMLQAVGRISRSVRGLPNHRVR